MYLLKFMRVPIFESAALLLALCLLAASSVFASHSTSADTLKKDLFAGDTPLHIRLEGDVGELMDDRGEDPSYHQMKLYYSEQDSPEHTLDLRVRVRGNFRRLEENCAKPPLKFNFKDHEAPDSSLFTGQKELKLVVPCDGEKYVRREYLTYKLYNLITDYSFRVRQVRFSYHDTEKNRTSDTVFAFLIEDQDLLATRKGATLYDRNNLRPESIDEQPYLRMSVFAYLIGNTDWSVQYQHNLKVLFLDKEKVFVTVPYDFDLVGLVDSPYAEPAEALRLRSVRDRVYRGHCLEDLSKLDPVFDEFRDLKTEIYALYTGNTLVDEDYIKETLEYFDEFYETINDRKKREKVFSYPCSQYGTGNVVISGMDN